MTDVRDVAFVTHPRKRDAPALEARLRSWVEDHGLTCDGTKPDLVVSLGGDGTMLRAAHVAHAADALLLGVNLGTLGYLTEVDSADAVDAVDAVLQGRHAIELRMMLGCRVESDDGIQRFVGLNEVLVERASGRRLIRLAITIDGESLADFNADGVIVATPTGSTAYALSAGGPIVAPGASCIVLVPVNAHIIFSRPFVLDDGQAVEIEVRGDGPAASVSLDGVLGTEIVGPCRTIVERHPRPLKLVRVGGPRFIERLRRKLDLPGGST